MSDLRYDNEPSGLGIQDILFVLFKHKKKILLGALLGIGAAAAVYFLHTPIYESQAKLLVRYVVERSAVDPEGTASGPGKTSDNVINSEVEILTSWDLALEVADAIGVEKMLPGSGGASTTGDAARTIVLGLNVLSGRGSNVIVVSYKHPDRELAKLVLEKLVSFYFTKHLEIHRSLGASEFVQIQIDGVKTRLHQTEDALKKLKRENGVVSLADSTVTLNMLVAKTQDELHQAEAEQAEQQGLVAEMEKAQRERELGEPDNAVEELNGETVQRYQALVLRLGQLRLSELELLSKYAPETRVVKLHQEQIAGLQSQRRDLEKKFPALIGTASSQPGQRDLPSERARLAGLDARTEMLEVRLTALQERRDKLAEIAPQIADLERSKELEEANYRNFGASLEKARVDQALDPAQMPNISVVQKPTAAMRTITKVKKPVLGLAVGGLGCGIAFALLAELLFNRTIKRPMELETRLRIPLLLSIPYKGRNRKRLQKANGKSNPDKALAKNGRPNVAPWEPEHFIRPYSEAIRDRLGLYFELNNMTHKPKLIAVTGFSEGAGTSTLAAGVAAALSEMDDGKVLLVDMNLDHAEVHPFFKGRPACSLNAALQPSTAIPSAADNLYLATVTSPNPGRGQMGLKRFYEMMPDLKASDFDYIIFDMPALSQTSPTLGMAGFMDKVLVVVEAEKSNLDAVKRGYSELVAGRANVSVIFNKAQCYAPKWVDGEMLSSP